MFSRIVTQTLPSCHVASVIRVLTDLERLGGSVGYEEHLRKQQSAGIPPVSQLQTSANWENTFANGIIAAAVVYTAVTIYAGDYTGSGGAWGIGLGVGGFMGPLSHDSWSTLTSKTNSFTILTEPEVSTMTFSIGGDEVAKILSMNLGLIVTAGFDGTIDWE